MQFFYSVLAVASLALAAPTERIAMNATEAGVLGDQGTFCAARTCSQGGVSIWYASCEWDPKPISNCRMCIAKDPIGSGYDCHDNRSPASGGSAAIMQCGSELVQISCNM